MYESVLPILEKSHAWQEPLANARSGLSLTLVKLGRPREALPLRQRFQAYMEEHGARTPRTKLLPLLVSPSKDGGNPPPSGGARGLEVPERGRE